MFGATPCSPDSPGPSRPERRQLFDGSCRLRCHSVDLMLEAAAEKAELTGQIRAFLAWVGPGRKLTAAGRIGLADARHLVELLGTGDTIDPDIGGRVFKTRSSEDLAHLSRIVAWAKAARLVRVTGTRLVPVKKNAALA